MKKSHFLFVCGAMAALTATANAKIVINEFCHNDTGTDNMEFIELHNTGATDVNLDGYRIVFGSNVTDTAPDGVELNFTFDNTSVIPAGGYYLLATNPEDSKLLLTLYPVNLTLSSRTDADRPKLRNYKSFVTLYNPTTSVEDSVVWLKNERRYLNNGDTTTNYFPNGRPLPAGHGEPASDGTAGGGGGIRVNLLITQKNNSNTNDFSNGESGESNSSLTFQRNPDLQWIDTDDNDADFFLAMATPGAKNFSKNLVENSGLTSANGIVFDFEGGQGTVESRLAGTFFNMHNQLPDFVPATLGTGNPSGNTSVISAAPTTGGNGPGIGVHWNHLQDQEFMGYGVPGVLSLKEAVADVEVETYVYVGPVLPNEGTDVYWEGGSFAILRGRPDAYPMGHNAFPYYEYDNGDTGIRLYYRNNEPTSLFATGSGKYIVTFGEQLNGVATTFGTPIEVNTPGWYRVLVSVKGDKTVAYFGGNFGDYTSADGTLTKGIRFPATQREYYTTSILRPGTVGYNYHARIPLGADAAAKNANKKKFRPATFDHLVYRKPTVINSSAVSNWDIY